MKQSKLATSLFFTAALLSSSTFAHLSFKGEAMPIVALAPHNWTGVYLGLNAGAVKNTMSITDNQATSFNATIQQVANPKFSGGLQLGYRYQVNPAQVSGVYGVEFSTNFSNASFSKQYGSPFALYQLSSTESLKTLCLLELTGGIAADRTLLFLAAGLSWANITGNVTNLDSVPFFNSFNTGKKVMGTALGGGAEYAFTDRISARFKVDVVTPFTYSSSDNTGNTFQIANNIVQATLGVNYNFG